MHDSQMFFAGNGSLRGLQNEDFRKLFLRFEMLVNGSGGVKHFFQRIDNFWEELQDMTAYRKLGFRLDFHLKGSVFFFWSFFRLKSNVHEM